MDRVKYMTIDLILQPNALQATAVRESVLSVDCRDDSILLNICKSRDRSKAAKAVPGIGKLYIKVTRGLCSTPLL